MTQVPDVYRDMYQHVKDEDRQSYLGMVTAMDDAVGNITQALVDNGLYDNSVILWFSDNGGPAANWPPGDIRDRFNAVCVTDNNLCLLQVTPQHTEPTIGL